MMEQAFYNCVCVCVSLSLTCVCLLCVSLCVYVCVLRTIFSDSPTHLDVSDEADMLKNVALLAVATAFASIVLPVPGEVTHGNAISDDIFDQLVSTLIICVVTS